MADSLLDVRIGLLGGFEVWNGETAIRLPLAAQRLLAVLALRDRGLHRTSAAELLWPAGRRGRAAANLRSALCLARRVEGTTVIECDGQRLRLASDIGVDQQSASVIAHHLMGSDRHSPPGAIGRELISALSRALLPDWLDEWLLLERERWDQIRLHALEKLALDLLAADSYYPALEAAYAAIAVDPVRESAHRTVMQVYLAEGNTVSAHKHYQRYQASVQREIGVPPSRQMTDLLRVASGH
ncbi:MAG: transcriptional regulator [Pseudonocardia sp.]|nr:transcriptional regulator [Pseudonocardia sp.]